MESKKCRICKENKDINLFSNLKNSKDGKYPYCKICDKEYKQKTSKKYQNSGYLILNNKKCTRCLINQDIKNFFNNKNTIDGKSTWCKSCSKKHNEFKKEEHTNYRKNRKDIQKVYSSNYYINNREREIVKSIEYKKIKRKTDPLFKLKDTISTGIYQSFRIKNYSKAKNTINILGCTIEEFKKHLESKFENWMTWENRGLYNGEFNFGWDIDHIIPLSSAKDEEDVYKLNHYINLQPLCSKINREIKKDKL
jgi:hypothetical protein